jgi:Holliday junction resolvase-like predicted endonuclease
MIEENAPYIIKESGEKESWSKDKLERSLRAARATEELVREIVRHIEKDLRDGMRTRDLYRHALNLLKRYDRPVAARYSLRQALMQLGPSGFPFERFVAKILENEGYKTHVGITVQGACVDHEVDVIAEKSGERILVEAKYHNTREIKSDVKVALYVHARFMDIEKRVENTAAGIGFFTQAWLITNTNFTSQAIKYGKCSGLSMTGWNYPKGRTLQDIVESSQTHPITCLTTLPTSAKEVLLKEGLILCSDALKETHVLKKTGLNESRVAAVVREAEALCPII